METTKRTRLLYAGLVAVWAVILVWQIAEHRRLRQAAQAALINRARDISNTASLVLRSQRRFGGIISRDRLESALSAVVRSGEVQAIALQSASGDIVAAAGSPIDPESKILDGEGEHWSEQSVALMNLVDLGTNVASEIDETNPPIVLSSSEIMSAFTNRPPPFGTNRPPGGTNGFFPPLRERRPPPSETNVSSSSLSSNSLAGSQPGPPPGPPGGRRRPRLGRPFWMSESEYKTAIEKQGVHSFIIVMSTQAMRGAIREDLWLRGVILVLGSVSVAGLGMAWRNLARTSELEVRLVRAAELNTRLKEMNLAAAGLAHETRNPLNIIRGLAQMISKQPDATPEVRKKSAEILTEADRVTAQLNEFMDFSRPREVRRAAVALNSAVGEVVRALGTDLDEKAIRLEVAPDLPVVEADEQLLRQALFNLLMNATQAVDRNGEIKVTAERTSTGVTLEIRDNGPGVPPEQRTEIFRPYFTTQQKGTGLGLAVVHQIVLAHGWEIACLANEPRGARFRITHLRPVA